MELKHDLIPFLLSIGFFYIAESYIIFKTTSMHCEANPKYIANATCQLKAINRYKAVANMECDIVDVLRNISVDFQSFVKNDANKYQPFVVNSNGNACDAMKKMKLPILHDLFQGFVKNMSNFNHTCPYRGRFVARNFYVNEKLLPVFPMPPGFYKGVFRFMEGYPFQSLGNVTLFVQVMELRRDPNSKRH